MTRNLSVVPPELSAEDYEQNRKRALIEQMVRQGFSEWEITQAITGERPSVFATPRAVTKLVSAVRRIWVRSPSEAGQATATLEGSQDPQERIDRAA